MAKIILVTSLMVAYAYLTEFFMAWYGGNPWEQFQFLDRVLGPMWWCGWIMLGCNAVVPQLLWFKSARRNVWLLFVVCILINVGMWFERFVIIVVGLHRDFLPSSWGSYCPSYVEVLTLIGSFGLFMTLFLLFCRWLPMVAMAEVKGILAPRSPEDEDKETRRQGDKESEEVSASPSVSLSPCLLVSPSPSWGLLAEYRDVASLRVAAERVRNAGYQRWDCHCPFPVHGLDRAMGVRPTRLPWLVLAAGLIGGLTALGLQWYCNSPSTAIAEAGGLSGYPLIFSGKPYLSLPANIPIIFELTVLFASLMAFFGLWTLVGLPRLHFPAFASRRFHRTTDDRFFITIQAKDEKFEPARTKKFLTATDCVALEEIHDD